MPAVWLLSYKQLNMHVSFQCLYVAAVLKVCVKTSSKGFLFISLVVPGEKVTRKYINKKKTEFKK